MYSLEKVIYVSYSCQLEFVYLFNLINMVELRVANIALEKMLSANYINLYSYDGITYFRTFERFDTLRVKVLHFLVFGK